MLSLFKPGQAAIDSRVWRPVFSYTWSAVLRTASGIHWRSAGHTLPCTSTCGRPLAPVDKSIWPATKVHRGTATVRVSNALYGLQTCLFGVYFIYPAPLRGFFREKWWPAILMWSTGQVGFVALFEYFSGFEFFLLPSRIHARPHAGNANR